MSTQSQNSQNTSRAVLLIVGVILLAALGYFAVSYFAEKKENEANLANIKELNEEVMELEEKILNFEVSIQDKNMELAEKDRLLEEKYMELEAVVGRLAQSKKRSRADEAKIRQLESKVRELQGFVDEYKAEVDFLKAENNMLTGKVDSLNVSTNRLTRENSSLRQTSQNTEQQLQETKAIAATLKASDFRYFNIRKSGKRSEERVFKRNRMRDMEICFSVLENPLAEAGNTEVFLVYENPDGTLLTNNNKGLSGSFLYKGQTKTYTAKSSFYYDKSRQEVCVAFSPEDSDFYQKGTQYISLYSGGQLIGQGNFELK